jgi:putative PIN family toxin of toxin-antitoxin system
MLTVIDTNVLVSGLLNSSGAPGQVIGLIFDNKIIPCYDHRTMHEYERILSLPVFPFSQSDRTMLINYIRAYGVLVSAHPVDIAVPDKSDLPFIEVALTAEAHCIITGNTRHFPRILPGVRIEIPAAFIATFFF